MFVLMETRNNGPVLFKIPYWCTETANRCLWPREGQDGNGLQLGPLFFKFSLGSSKKHYKLIKFCSPFKNSFHGFFPWSSKTILCIRKCS